MEKQINQECQCTYPCSRHGDCQACLAYHIKTGTKTNCGRDENTEREGK